jgi:Cu/Zn superoxide dismutase
MARGGLLGALLLGTGCLRDTPGYCDTHEQCGATEFCSLPEHACMEGARPVRCTTNKDCGEDQICVQPTCLSALARADLSGNQQVPPTCSLSEGTLLLAKDATSNNLFYSLMHNVPEAMVVDIHEGRVEEGGPVVFTLSAASGTLDRVAISVDQEAQLRAGGYYVDIHSATFKTGELRGQLWPLGAAAGPGVTELFAVLSGQQQAPPNTSKATGTATVTYDAQTGAVSYAANHTLDGGVSGIHIHRGAFNVNGAHLFDLPTTSDKAFNGVLTREQAQTGVYGALLRSGVTYFNIHTVNRPGGELRGQLLPYQKSPLSFALPFNVLLEGKQVVPPVNTAAQGVAQFFLSKDRMVLTYRLEHKAQGVVSAHIHRALSGMNGPEVCALAGGRDGGQGVCPIKTAGGVADLVLSELLRPEGGYYVDIHTGANPGGELRGQLIVPIPR